MSSNPKAWIAASALVGFTAAIVWFGAPLVPALIGAVLAGLILYYSGTRS